MSDRPSSGIRHSSDIYTVLLILATLLLVGSTIYLMVRSNALFGSWLPFGGA